MALEVLVVDDEADIRELVAGVLEDEGYTVRTAADSTSALDAVEDRRPSLVLLDVWLQGSRLDGLQLLEAMKSRDPTLPVIMAIDLGGHPEMAVDRHWDTNRLADLHRRACRLGLQPLRHPTEVVAEREDDETPREDGDPGQSQDGKLRQRFSPRHQPAEHQHRGHQDVETAQHDLLAGVRGRDD